MALQTSGAITMAQIQAEFGGSNPVSLSEYYAGGANVPSGTSGTNGAVPTSLTISLWNFYGTAAASAWSGTISTNQTNLNLATWASANGWNGTSAATITINSGVYVYSTSTGTPGLTTGSFPGGLTIINNGYIMGQGGTGGGGTGGGSIGGVGGPALSISTNCTITNNSYIAGGGGGGGGALLSSGGGGAGGGAAGDGAGGASPGTTGANGTASGACYPGSTTWSPMSCSGAGMGGDGGRILPGTGGAGGDPYGSFDGFGGGSGGGGAAWNSSAGGNPYGGGVGGSANNAGTGGTGQGGGGGGGWGAAGGTGYIYSGGDGGAAVNQNGYSVTWTATGTRYGAINT